MKNFIKSFFVIATFFTLSLTVHAASSYTVTDATGTVGVVDSTFEIEYTLDTAQQTWANGDTLTITLPDNYPAWSAWTFAVERDTDVTNDATNETAITEHASDNGTYSTSARIMTIRWDQTTWSATDNFTIRVLGTAGNAPTYVDATSTFTFAGTTAAADINPSGTDDVNVSVGALSSTNIEPSQLTASSSTTNTITFTTTTVIPNLGKIALTYPSGFDVSGANTLTAGSLSGLDGTWTAGVSGQVITLTQTGGSQSAAGAKSFTLAGIVNPSSAGNAGTYTIQTQIAAGTAIEQDASVTTDFILGNSSAASLMGLENLTAVDNPNGAGVLLTWDEPYNDDSTNVNVLRAEGDDVISANALAIVDKGIKTYTDLTAETGKTYKYAVRTSNGEAYGPTSNEVSITVEETSTETTTTEETSTETTTNETETNNETTNEVETGTEVDTNTSTEPEVTEDNQDSTETDNGTEDEAKTATFSDIENHWAKAEIEEASTKGIFTGNPDGTFKPDAPLNRAEAAATIYRILFPNTEPEAPSTSPFSDVSPSDWYSGYISKLKDEKIISGNPDGTYEPAEKINRAEFLTLALKAYLAIEGGEIEDTESNGTFADVESDSWYRGIVYQAFELELIKGTACGEDTCFKPTENITRAEAAVILNRY